MSKIVTVALREYWFNLRRPAFLFAAFGVPVLVLVGFVLGSLGDSLGGGVSVDDYGPVGYVDYAAVTAPGVTLDYAPDYFQNYPTEDSARVALDDDLIGGYFVIPENYIQTGRIDLYSYESVPENLESRINDLLVANMRATLDTDIPYERIIDPADSTIEIQSTGRVVEGVTGLLVVFFLPILFAFLIIISSATTSGFLMYGLVEEKTNRIIEILVTSVKPIELLTGKIIGLGLLGLTQVMILIVAGIVGLQLAQGANILSDFSLPLDLALVAIIYYLLTYFMLAALLAGLGAVVGSEQESRQLSTFITLPVMVPYFFFFTFLNDPNGTLPMVLSFFPLTSPMTMLIRYGLTDIPTWQIILSIVILVVTIVLLVWASAKLFRWGLLLYGKRFRPLEVLRVIFSRDVTEMGTSASEPQEVKEASA